MEGDLTSRDVRGEKLDSEQGNVPVDFFGGFVWYFASNSDVNRPNAPRGQQRA